MTPVDRLIGAALIDQVDDWGYCRVDIAELAHHARLRQKPTSSACCTLMQGFEPVGVMARNLVECLALQLKDRDRFDPAMAGAARQSRSARASDQLDSWKSICGVDREDLDDMIAEIRALTPKPGAGFGGGAGADRGARMSMCAHAPDGVWAVELNTDTLPRILMNQRYYARVSKIAKNDEDKAFLSECAANASWLMKSLDQRARTILKVAREIVRQQDGFLAHGVAHLRPLNLKTVAAAIEMHESTVSRVTTNKYISTPRGVFELKYFFTASIPASDGGEAHSAEAVRHRIRI